MTNLSRDGGIIHATRDSPWYIALSPFTHQDVAISPYKARTYEIVTCTHFKLYLAYAVNSFKWVGIVQICKKWHVNHSQILFMEDVLLY